MFHGFHVMSSILFQFSPLIVCLGTWDGSGFVFQSLVFWASFTGLCSSGALYGFRVWCIGVVAMFWLCLPLPSSLRSLIHFHLLFLHLFAVFLCFVYILQCVVHAKSSGLQRVSKNMAHHGSLCREANPLNFS